MSYRHWYAKQAKATGTRMNPTHPEQAYNWDPRDTILVVQNEGIFRIWTMRTPPVDAPQLGANEEIINADNDRFLGYFRVVGRVLQDGTTEGEIPDKKIAHWIIA